MILVAGGTGTLGTWLVPRLQRRGLSLRILTRDAARLTYQRGEHLAVVEGDVRDRASMLRAMAGVDTVVSAVHGFAGSGGVSPASVDRDGNANLIDAAAAEGASVVLVSVVGASADSPMELFRMKYAAEQHLRASGIPWTIVRATAYLETWIGLLQRTAGRSGRPVVFGRGDNPINFVSAGAVAALLEHAITDPSARGQILQIGGPQNLSLNQLAATLQEAAGLAGEPRRVPRAVLRSMAIGLRPFKTDLARQAEAALVMDSANMTFEATAVYVAYPDIPKTTLADLLTQPA